MKFLYLISVYQFTCTPERKVCSLMRKVGNFAVCEICNNIADIMAEGRRNWSQAQREILKMYRRKHIAQQAAERKLLEQVRQHCAESDPQTGQPMAMQFFIDAMTATRCDTYRSTTEAGRISKSEQNTDHVESRVWGCNVVCGKFDKFILYTTDNMIGGGANVMIEVVRQLLIDVEQILASMNMKRPFKLYLQLDNW